MRRSYLHSTAKRYLMIFNEVTDRPILAYLAIFARWKKSFAPKYGKTASLKWQSEE